MSPIITFFKDNRRFIGEISFDIACVVVGFFLATKYLHTTFDIKTETDRIRVIDTQIKANNDACVKAVESNKKLKSEYDQRMDKVSSLLLEQLGKTEKTISENADVPASVPVK